MHVVAAVVDQGALTFDFAIPCEVFGTDRRDIVDPWYEFLVVAAGDKRVRTQTGFVLEAEHGLEALARADTIVVPGWSDPDDEPSEALVRHWWRRTPAARGSSPCARAPSCSARRACSTGGARRPTGCTPNGFGAATRTCGSMPTCSTSPTDRVMTSAGTAAGVDLCLHLVALDHGVDVAATVARRLVMPLYRSGGQAQYVDAPVDPAPGGLAVLLDWARSRIGDGISVEDLASRGAMSVRTLNRRFRAALAMPPGEWLQRERLRLAQRLLESGDAPIATVARRAGYDSPATMRAQFAARLQTSPRAYRETFRGRPVSAA